LLYSWHGEIVVTSAGEFNRDTPRGVPQGPARYHWRVGKPGSCFVFAGLIPQDPNAPMFFSLKVSHWLLAALSLILPALWTVKMLRRSRPHADGLCVKCGYDLRCTPDRCPECGTAVAIKS
jgi:hypothetical protein